MSVVTITAVDTTHFGLNGRSMPRVYAVFPSGEQDAELVCTIDQSRIRVQSGSTVAGATDLTQAGLIADLAAVVMPAVPA
jgi:hypothetical protein